MNKTNSIRLLRAATIDDVDPILWDSILPEGDVINSHNFLKAEEKSGINKFRYRYCMFFEKDELIAHASVGILSFGLDVMADKSLKKFFSVIKKIIPSFMRITLIECGHPTAIGSALVMRDESRNPEIIEFLNGELRSIAREEKTHLIALRDVYTADFSKFKVLRAVGYRPIPNMANTFFKVSHKSFDQYLSDLVAKRRREIRHRLKTFYDSGCTIELIEDFASLAPDLAILWNNTYEHAKEYQREILNEAYFRYMSQFMGDRSFIFLCRKKGKPIGFTMFMDGGESLISTYCGLDYGENRSTFTYFVLFYKSVEEAIRREKKWLELGVTNYNPKIEIGAIPEPMYIYARSLKPVFNLFLAPLMGLMNSSPDFNKRNIFNNRYFERFPVPVDLQAHAGKVKVRIIDVSQGGLSVDGYERLSGNVNLTIPGDFPIRLTARVRNVTEIESGDFNAESGDFRSETTVFRTGLNIVKGGKEHLFQWQLFVRGFGGENGES